MSENKTTYSHTCVTEFDPELNALLNNQQVATFEEIAVMRQYYNNPSGNGKISAEAWGRLHSNPAMPAWLRRNRNRVLAYNILSETRQQASKEDIIMVRDYSKTPEGQYIINTVLFGPWLRVNNKGVMALNASEHASSQLPIQNHTPHCTVRVDNPEVQLSSVEARTLFLALARDLELQREDLRVYAKARANDPDRFETLVRTLMERVEAREALVAKLRDWL